MKFRLAALALVALALPLVACGDDKEAKVLSGYQLTPPPAVGALSMPDASADGAEFTFVSAADRYLIVYFGYTSCPDVCPTSMTELTEVKRLLGADADKLQGVFVTVDPVRDTAELLKAYMANFDPSFVAFVPTEEELVKVAKDFKIYYKKVEGKTPTSYTMDHSAGSYVYDTQGRLRLYSRYGSGPQVLAQDIQLLLK